MRRDFEKETQSSTMARRALVADLGKAIWKDEDAPSSSVVALVAGLSCQEAAAAAAALGSPPRHLSSACLSSGLLANMAATCSPPHPNHSTGFHLLPFGWPQSKRPPDEGDDLAACAFAPTASRSSLGGRRSPFGPRRTHWPWTYAKPLFSHHF